jgi:protein-tyrosine phosphatase
MTPLADTHVHLHWGTDDGPASLEEAIAMCRQLAAEGVRSAAALSHQNDGYPLNTKDALMAKTKELAGQLKELKIPIHLYTSAEIMAGPALVEKWNQGEWLSIGNHKKFLLVEMPHGMFLDLRPAAKLLRTKGVRIIVAHAERYPELLHDSAMCEEWIKLGCLIQVTARGVARPASGPDDSAIRKWIRNGMVHLLGSDGHNLDRRPPKMKEGYDAIARIAGTSAADRIGSIWGTALLQGLPVNVPMPTRPKQSWFSRLFGS